MDVPPPEMSYQSNTSEQVQVLKGSGSQSRLCRVRRTFVRGLALAMNTQEQMFFLFFFSPLLSFTKTALCDVPRGSEERMRSDCSPIESMALAQCGKCLPRSLPLSGREPDSCLSGSAAGDLSVDTSFTGKGPQITSGFVGLIFGLTFQLQDFIQKFARKFLMSFQVFSAFKLFVFLHFIHHFSVLSAGKLI